MALLAVIRILRSVKDINCRFDVPVPQQRHQHQENEQIDRKSINLIGPYAAIC